MNLKICEDWPGATLSKTIASIQTCPSYPCCCPCF
jgi:hypothetical protein